MDCHVGKLSNAN